VARLVGGAFLPRVPGKRTIDHIDRVRDNNCVTNLRWANSTEQSLNRDHPLGATGHKHITRQRGKWWKVQIKRNKRMLYTKMFLELDDAIAARDAFISSYSETPEILTDATVPLPSP